MFDFTLTEEQHAIQTLVREFVQREVKPRAAALDAEQDPTKSIPWDIIKAADQVGLRNLAMRESLGGGGQARPHHREVLLPGIGPAVALPHPQDFNGLGHHLLGNLVFCTRGGFDFSVRC